MGTTTARVANPAFFYTITDARSNFAYRGYLVQRIANPSERPQQKSITIEVVLKPKNTTDRALFDEINREVIGLANTPNESNYDYDLTYAPIFESCDISARMEFPSYYILSGRTQIGASNSGAVVVPPKPTEETPSEEETPLGGDRDEYGCIPSAGYEWCPTTKKCIRPWEDTCPAEVQNTCTGTVFVVATLLFTVAGSLLFFM